MATLCQKLLALEVVHREALFEARTAVRQAHEVTNSADDLGEDFDEILETLQFAVTRAAVFCVEGWPMHMNRGVGCGVLDQKNWASTATTTFSAT